MMQLLLESLSFNLHLVRFEHIQNIDQVGYVETDFHFRLVVIHLDFFLGFFLVRIVGLYRQIAGLSASNGCRDIFH